MQLKPFTSLVLTLTSAAFLLLAAFSSLSAATISINSVTGTWTSVTGGSNISGLNTNQVSWGIPANDDHRKSSYKFVGSAPPSVPVTLDSAFSLGTFTHFNYPIEGNTGITAARLVVAASITIDSVTKTYNFTYDFNHNETPNREPCQAGSVSVCDDIVSIVNNAPLSDIISIGGVDYTVNIFGFQVGQDQFSQFMTREEKNNSAILRASISVPVPEPGTYLLLGSFLCAAIIVTTMKRRARLIQQR